MFFLQGTKLANPGTGKQGVVEGEEGVLGSGPDEDEGALFEVGQEGVLLALVEMVDLVQK
jgi:hypothetical protein